MSYTPLALKYRPKTFSELVGQEVLATTLLNMMVSGEVQPVHVFSGPRGVGKTTTARILAAALNCETEGAEPCGGNPPALSCGPCESCAALNGPTLVPFSAMCQAAAGGGGGGAAAMGATGAAVA